MTTLAELARAAGLMTPENAIFIPNFQLPLVSNARNESTGLTEPLYCDRTLGSAADLTILYFTLPGCENCRPAARALGRMRNETLEKENPRDLKLCVRLVVSDWQTSAEVVQEWDAGQFAGFEGVVWDSSGVLSERLAVVAQPAFFMLDKGGRIVAYQNGPVELDSVGFAGFWKKLVGQLRSEEFRASEMSLAQHFNVELAQLSSRPVSFLNQGLLPSIWLVVSIALCYSLIRFFLRLRKNFTGSQNSS
jgi:hypothetical protein